MTVLALWHLPGPYQRTLDSDLVHSAQHASFLAVALILSLFAIAVLVGSLGAPSGVPRPYRDAGDRRYRVSGLTDTCPGAPQLRT